MRPQSLLALVLFFVLAIPASAGTLAVGSASASQFSYPYFTAAVVASDTTVITDAHLLVNGVPVVADQVDRLVLDGVGNYVMFTFKKYATDVVKPGDVVTAVVRDQDADSAERLMPCSAPSKKKTSETAVCK